MEFDTPMQALSHICEGLLDEAAALANPEPISAEQVPEPYAELLVHNEHMTVRLEKYHGQPVRLRVLQEHIEDNIYRREIVLLAGASDMIVEVGIVRLNLDKVPADVRTEILDRDKPLGDILIDHDILRRIEPRWYLRFTQRCGLLLCFSDPPPETAFGRIGTIHCNGEAAIELLEVVTDRKGGMPSAT